MPRAPIPRNLDELMSHKAVGKAIVQAMRDSERIAKALDTTTFAPEDGLMLNPPVEGAPPELYTLWSLSQSVRDLNRLLAADGLSSREQKDLMASKASFLSQIHSVQRAIRSSLLKSSQAAIGAALKAAGYDLRKREKGLTGGDDEDDDVIDVEKLEESLSEADLERMAREADA